MRKTPLHRPICFLLSFVFLLLLLPVSALAGGHESKLVRVGWYEGTYNTTDTDGQRRGYSYEYQQMIAAYTGWTYQYVTGDWLELIEMLQRGEIDLLGTVSYSDERAENMLFSELPMGEEKYYLYADLLNTDISVSDLTTLNGKRLGMLTGGLPAMQFSEWEENHELHVQHVDISGADDIRKQLAEKQIDGIVVNESPVWGRENLSAIAVVGGSEIYFAINKERPDLKEELDIAMRQIQHNTPFYADDLYKRYLSSNSLEVLTEEEHEWLTQHGSIRIGYLKNDSGISLDKAENNRPVGIINDYVDFASDCLGRQALQFELVGFDSQEEQLHSIRTGRIDMVFHVNHNPYEAEQSGIALSGEVFSVNVAAITGKNYFDESAENMVAISRGNLLSKWYVSYNYPHWKIQEYATSEEVIKAVHDGKADCFIVKAGQTSKALEDTKVHAVFLTQASESSFAVARNNTILLSILNKTLKILPSSNLSGAFSVYESVPGKVTLKDYIKDNLLPFVTAFTGFLLLVMLIILHSLQKAKNAEQKAKAAQLQAEKANAAKTRFLSRMSHDMRTPLNGIIGLLKIDQNHFDDLDFIKSSHEKMQTSADHLLSLINDVLQMGKIEDSSVVLAHEVIDFTQLAHEIHDIIEEKAAESGITLVFPKESTGYLYPYVYGSPLHLRQIFLNVYGNCIKYNRVGGTITTTADVLKEKDGYCRYRWTISDTGIGMSKEFIEHIFEPFAQEKEDARSVYNGVGLGMAIVKGLVDQMDGEISVTSKEGVGSAFTITIPFEIAPAPVQKAEAAPVSGKNLQGLHLLLAEDNALNAEIAEVLLTDQGANVTVVSNGQQAVDMFTEKPQGTFDAILTDIMMPVMDGITEAKTIRALERADAQTIPIIAMTANAFKEDEQKCLDAGMNAHLAKPLNIDKVKEVICKLVR